MSTSLFSLVLVLATAQAPAPNEPQLKPLEFLVGDWTANPQLNGQELRFEGGWEWSLNRNFIASDLQIKVAGATVFQAKSMFGWDAKSKRIVAWAFHSDGKHFTSKVSAGDRSVTWDSVGVDAEGNRVTETLTIKATGEDTLNMVVSNRKAGDQSLPDISLVWTRAGE